MENTGYIYGINGPIAFVKGYPHFQMSEMVLVGEKKLIGEVIRINGAYATVQVFEETSGLAVHEPVYATGSPVSVTLGPGIIGNIFDGIQRPLKDIKEHSGAFIGKGMALSNLDTEKKWEVMMQVSVGDIITGGQVIALTPETASIVHKAMTPPDIAGEVVYAVENGAYNVTDTLITVKDAKGIQHNIALSQKWPIKVPRPVKARKSLDTLLVTGQRVIDTLFPIAKGGTAALPGGFGTGKTMTQHQLAKWSDADIIIYIGCGERGNEMTQVLEDFSGLKDPKSGKGLMERTTLIANTSNMPVAAREASIYTGVTLAEYYRDMGYHVAIMADSTSRWAEALRELSGRLQEMPAEEGFPAYLASRLAQFYERAGYMETLSGLDGSITMIGAVSPQGGDFSEPVTQNTKRFVRAFWTLDRSLAYARHYPAIQWMTSYSEYTEDCTPWYLKHAGPEFLENRSRILQLLQEESALNEIVKLIGSDVLPDSQKLVLEISRIIRLGFVQQNAYHPQDTFVPIEKQAKMMETILYLYDRCKELVDMGLPVQVLKEENIFEKLIAMKYDIPNGQLSQFTEYKEAIDAFYLKIKERHV